jgi:hypothetical protein
MTTFVVACSYARHNAKFQERFSHRLALECLTPHSTRIEESACE